MSDTTDPKPTLVESKDVYIQPSDCCQSGSMEQQLTVSTQDGGGGAFLVIETERWALDDVDEFCALLKKTLSRVAKEEAK